MSIVYGLSELERAATLRVVEIFHSIQGEGAATGRAATFVRLAGCNRACEFCDTDFSTFAELTVGGDRAAPGARLGVSVRFAPLSLAGSSREYRDGRTRRRFVFDGARGAF